MALHVGIVVYLTVCLIYTVAVVSWTFAHRTLAENWYFIDARQVNRPF